MTEGTKYPLLSDVLHAQTDHEDLNVSFLNPGPYCKIPRQTVSEPLSKRLTATNPFGKVDLF